MDRPASVQHLHDLALRLVGHVWHRDLARHHVVRQVGEQAQVRHGVEQVERQQQIVGHPASMRLDQYWYLTVRRDPVPAFQDANAVGERPRPQVGLDGDVVGVEPGSEFRDRLQVVNAGRKTLRLDAQAARVELAHQHRGVACLVEMVADTIEAGLRHQVQLLVQAQLGGPALQPLHSPQGLEHQKLLHRRGPFRRRATSP